MDKYELRRRRVLEVIGRLFDCKQSDFARKVGLSESYLTRMLYAPERDGRKRIGEDMIDKIASALDIDPNWFDTPIPHEDLSARARGIRLDEFPIPVGTPVAKPPIISSAASAVSYVPLSRAIMNHPSGRVIYETVKEEEPAMYPMAWLEKSGLEDQKLLRLEMPDESQQPLLFRGDIALVHWGEKEIVDSKLYAIRYNDELRFRFIYKKLDGSLKLVCMNQDYPAEEVSAELAAKHITIIGRVRDKSGAGGI